jgi:penicillin-binding protein 2
VVMDYYLLGKLPEEEAAKPVDQIDEEGEHD